LRHRKTYVKQQFINNEKNMKTFYLFVSQPMKGWKEEDVLLERVRIQAAAEAKVRELAAGEETETVLIDSWIKDTPPEGCNVSMWYFWKSIEKMAEHPADVTIAIFGGDWRQAGGCKCENAVARYYGCHVIEL